ncbi:hypothetical protein [Rossellomorea marisflavi]|nr:hypothetical protein [Rossellomorea marisflavi]
MLMQAAPSDLQTLSFSGKIDQTRINMIAPTNEEIHFTHQKHKVE